MSDDRANEVRYTPEQLGLRPFVDPAPNSRMTLRAWIAAISLAAAVAACTFGLWPVGLLLAWLSGGTCGQIGTLHGRRLIDWSR
jgi:hypothetical protein